MKLKQIAPKTTTSHINKYLGNGVGRTVYQVYIDTMLRY